MHILNYSNNSLELSDKIKEAVSNNSNYVIVTDRQKSESSSGITTQLVFKNNIYNFYVGFEFIHPTFFVGSELKRSSVVSFYVYNDYDPTNTSMNQPRIYNFSFDYINGTPTPNNFIIQDNIFSLNYIQGNYKCFMMGASYLPYGSSLDFPNPNLFFASENTTEYFKVCYKNNNIENANILNDALFDNRTNGSINSKIFFSPFVIKINDTSDKTICGELPEVMVSGSFGSGNGTITSFNDNPSEEYISFPFYVGSNQVYIINKKN